MHHDIVDVFVTVNSFLENYNSETQMTDVIIFRDEVIHKITNIRDMIYQEHGEIASFYISLAICSYCDEMANHKSLGLSSSLSNWHLLQEEMYQRNDGGDYFFEIVDKVIDNPVFPKIINQVLYLILSLGFKGCYMGVQSEVDKYKNKLSVTLPNQDFEDDIFYSQSKKLNNNYRRTYKTKIMKGLFFASLCFPVVAYFSILFIN